MRKISRKNRGTLLAGFSAIFAISTAAAALGADAPDPLLDLFIKKGFVTEEEAARVKAEADALRTNGVAPEVSESRWKISKAIKSMELIGDMRLRFEDREARSFQDSKVELGRFRYAFRVGLRGDVMDNFYYGLRMETAANPRSPWVTFASSSSGTPYQGPFGKSQAGLNLGQLYLGWHPGEWMDITVGKMPNPIYTTPMVWDTDLNPEGAAERFRYSVGDVDFFATFGQFEYQDTNPNNATKGFFPNLLTGQSTSDAFLLAWQLGLNYHKKSFSAKVAPVLYNYTGRGADLNTTTPGTPGFADPFVGEGQNIGAVGSGTGNVGYSGFPNGQFDGFAANQTGINDLLVLDFPAEINFKLPSNLNLRLFGDFAENLQGKQRSEAAVAAIQSSNLGNGVTGPLPNVSPIPVQPHDNHAYQIGAAIGTGDNLGMVYGAVAKRHGWELRTYWQHVEQYALDPNLLDSDFFEGRGNLEGLYVAAAYGFTENVIGTFRYGFANRINNKLGTGGSNQDIPQVNPIEHYNLLQLDLTLRF